MMLWKRVNKMINLVYLFVGVFFGIIIGFLVGGGSALYGIKAGSIKDYYYIEYKPCERDLYKVEEGRLIRVMTIPKNEDWS